MQKRSAAVWNGAKAFWKQFRPGPGEGFDGGWERPVLGLALGGGFARGVAHIGVIRVLEREHIPIGAVAGVSAGSIVAACLASGADSHDLEKMARSMRFADLACWRLGRLGLARSERMEAFLRRVMPEHRIERMKIPLAIVATDLATGEPAVFVEGEVFAPVRASCSYPGLFQPVRHQGRVLVDGAIAMEVPAGPVRLLGAGKVLGVALPSPVVCPSPTSMFSIVHRCFQIMHRRTEQHWQDLTDVTLRPAVSGAKWDDFANTTALIEAGMAAAEAALPAIRAAMHPRRIRLEAGSCKSFQTEGSGDAIVA
jgi:NTE family protein